MNDTITEDENRGIAYVLYENGITGTADSSGNLTVSVNGVTYTEGDGNLTDNGDDTWILSIPLGNEIEEGVQENHMIKVRQRLKKQLLVLTF